jgi:hypothetical protein
LQQVTGALKELGATICAITPQLQEASRSLIEKHKITFDLLSDHGNEYAAKLGIRFKLPNDLQQVYPEPSEHYPSASRLAMARTPLSGASRASAGPPKVSVSAAVKMQGCGPDPA